jgi:hypothetical protein
MRDAIPNAKVQMSNQLPMASWPPTDDENLIHDCSLRLSFPRKRESRTVTNIWIPVPAFAGTSLPLRKQGQE